jgi:polar amino acid transport system substrate-binding protein
MRHSLIVPLLFIFLSSTAFAGETIILGTAEDQDATISRTTNLLLTECFHRLEFELTVLPRPSKRSISEADLGRVDGDFARTDAVARVYPNLIKVPEPIARESLTAFSTDPDLEIEGWGSLLPYHVAWVSGREICECHLGRAAKKTLESNEVALLRFLSEGRAKAGIMGLHRGRALLERLNITNVHPLSPPIEVARLYLYLHKKHEALVPRVAAMLRTLKEDGTYEAIRQHFFEGGPYPADKLLSARP